MACVILGGKPLSLVPFCPSYPALGVLQPRRHPTVPHGQRSNAVPGSGILHLCSALLFLFAVFSLPHPQVQTVLGRGRVLPACRMPEAAHISSLPVLQVLCELRLRIEGRESWSSGSFYDSKTTSNAQDLSSEWNHSTSP